MGKPSLRFCFLSLLALFILVACSQHFLRAQQGGFTKAHPLAPAISSLFPPGGKRGTKVEVTLAGKNLSQPTGVLATFPCKISIPNDKNNGKEKSKLRMLIEIPKDAPLGFHGVRVATEQSISNVQIFYVDDLPEQKEAATNRNKENAQEISIPSVISGRVDNLASDYYKFQAIKGQRVTLEILGRRLGNPLDPEFSLYSAKTGQELAHANDSPGLQTDGRLSYQFSEDGEYLVRVKDVLNRGGTDYVYRLRIGDFPCATVAVPMAVEKGNKVRVNFAGPLVEKVPGVTLVAKSTIGDPLYVVPKMKNGLPGVPVPVLLSDREELVEKEPNNQINQANPVPLPSGITGRLEKYGDKDFVVFNAKKGQQLTIQGHTLEQNSPTLLYLRVRDSKGKEIARSKPEANPPDDQEIVFNPPANGDYFVETEHLNYVGGPSQAYRLTLTPKQGSFQPSMGLDRFELYPGSSQLLPVQVKRENFNGPIDLEIISDESDLSGKALIGPNKNSGTLVLRTPKDISPGPRTIQIVGKAKIGGKEVTRLVDVGTSVRNGLSNLPYPPLHLTTRIGVAIVPTPPYQLITKLEKAELTPGDKTKISLHVQGSNDLVVSLINPEGLPKNFKFPKIKPIGKGKKETSFTFTVPTKAPLGKYYLQFKGKAKIKNQDVYASAEPVLLEVTRPFSLKVEPAPLKFKQGSKVKFKVTAQRNAGYKGPIRLEVRNLPGNVSANTPTIPANQNVAEVEISAKGDAQLGSKTNVQVVGTATALRNQQQASPRITFIIEKK